MARSCTVCGHPNRNRIDEALLNGTSIRDIARQYGLGRNAVDRHRAHIGTMLVEAGRRRAELEVDHGDDLLGMAYHLQREALALLQKAKSEGKDYLQLQAMDRLQKGIALLATLKESPAGQPTRITVKWEDACDHPCPECMAKRREASPPLLALPSGANGSGEVIDAEIVSK
jgi:hypothetical protein